MIAEDFAVMLKDRPDCYGWIGNDPDTDGNILHIAWYDFNDAALPGWLKCAVTRRGSDSQTPHGEGAVIAENGHRG